MGPVFEWADQERRNLVANKRRTEFEEGRLEAFTEMCQRIQADGEPPRQSKRREGPFPAHGECFEAILEVCGWDSKAMTASARGRANKALKELKDADSGLTPDKIRHAAAEWRRMHPKILVSPQVLTCHWPSLTKRFVNRAGLYDRKAEQALSRIDRIEEIVP